MTNDATTESGALIGIEMMTTKLGTSDPTNGVDEVGPVKIFEPVLVRVMGVGSAVEVIGRRILTAFLITCIL